MKKIKGIRFSKALSDLKNKIVGRACLIGILTACCFIACEKKENPPEDDVFPKTIEFTDIIKCDDISGGDFVKENIVVASQFGWNDLIIRLKESSNTNCLTDGLLTMEIDFSIYQIIAIFEEEKPDGIWSVDIMDIMEYSDRIVVSLSCSHTEFVENAATQPFRMIMMPASEKEIFFEYKENEDEKYFLGKWKIFGSGYFDEDNNEVITYYEQGSYFIEFLPDGKMETARVTSNEVFTGEYLYKIDGRFLYQSNMDGKTVFVDQYKMDLDNDLLTFYHVYGELTEEYPQTVIQIYQRLKE